MGTVLLPLPVFPRSAPTSLPGFRLGKAALVRRQPSHCYFSYTEPLGATPKPLPKYVKKDTRGQNVDGKTPTRPQAMLPVSLVGRPSRLRKQNLGLRSKPSVT